MEAGRILVTWQFSTVPKADSLCLSRAAVHASDRWALRVGCGQVQTLLGGPPEHAGLFEAPRWLPQWALLVSDTGLSRFVIIPLADFRLPPSFWGPSLGTFRALQGLIARPGTPFCYCPWAALVETRGRQLAVAAPRQLGGDGAPEP